MPVHRKSFSLKMFKQVGIAKVLNDMVDIVELFIFNKFSIRIGAVHIACDLKSVLTECNFSGRGGEGGWLHRILCMLKRFIHLPGVKYNILLKHVHYYSIDVFPKNVYSIHHIHTDTAKR